MLRAWVYPDACALDLLSAELAAPLVAIAQGTNVHSYLHMPLRRHLIVQALSRAAATITRSRDLATRLREAGVPALKLRPIYNGVDTATFHPSDPAALRRELGLPVRKHLPSSAYSLPFGMHRMVTLSSFCRRSSSSLLPAQCMRAKPAG